MTAMRTKKTTILKKDMLSNEQQATILTAEENELAELPWMTTLTVIALVAVILGWILEDATKLPRMIAWTLYSIAYMTGGYYSFQKAWESLRERQFDVNFLMIIAALGAAIVGQPREGSILMFLFSLSNTLETFAMGRTHASIRALMDMTPKTARVLRMQDGSNQEIELPVEQVGVQDIVLVRPGEQIPADGVVIKGESSVNEASITGESMPVEKSPSSKVFAGTINEQGALEIRVTTAVQNSTLARIVKIVSEAREQKAKSQDFTDRVIGQYYAYAVVGITLLALIIPPIFLGWNLQTTIYRAMTLMVVASPCALVISIPAALLSALASAARGGVLFKGSAHLEAASKVRVVAFDKTGTLTTGRPGIVEIIPLGDAMPEDIQCANTQFQAPPDDQLGQMTPRQAALVSLAAAVEQFSEHPLARAIVTGAKERGVDSAEAQDFISMTGYGVRATVCNRTIQVGRPSLFGTLSSDTASIVKKYEQQGRSVVMIGEPDCPWGLIAIADQVRPESIGVIKRLKESGISRVVLLTGDNRYVAEKLAQELGVDEVKAELFPEDKVEAVRELQRIYGPVAMVGDGINDAPALATATLGIAMGAAGTDVALESADVLLMSDDLSRLPGALKLARRSRQVVRQNLIFAFSVMSVLMILAMGGTVPLTLGVVAHEGSTLLVVANGLRLLLPWK